eukprot:5672689-Pleurochrysis_carterae.AAC.2
MPHEARSHGGLRHSATAASISARWRPPLPDLQLRRRYGGRRLDEQNVLQLEVAVRNVAAVQVLESLRESAVARLCA